MDDIKGVIYILTNPSFPKFIKIGYADDVSKRLKELNRSECVPYAFRLFAYLKTPNRLSDKAVHKLIDTINPNLRTIESINGKNRVREFFEMSADAAYQILCSIADITGQSDKIVKVDLKNDKAEIDDNANVIKIKSGKKARLKVGDLYNAGLIRQGDEVYLSKNPNEIGVIESSQRIKYKGQVLSFNEFGKQVSSWNTIDIYLWLIIKRCNKTLDELRTNLEQNQIVETSNKVIVKKETVKKRFLRIVDLFNEGYLIKGDEIYHSLKVNEIAIIESPKSVNYKGQSLSYNEFGKLVMSWKALDVYDWLIAKRYGKTLGELRNMLSKNNTK